jgi:predicted enzyme related to lactoylglutathione lyase
MLKNANSFSSFSVKDLEEAKAFYKDKLGFEISDQPGPLRFSTNGCNVMIYEKQNHQAADFTILNFAVEDLSSKIDELNAVGVKFLQYDNEHFKTDEKGIFHGDHGDIAWMEDPSGNIISVLTSSEV